VGYAVINLFVDQRVEPGKEAAALVLAGLLVSFAFIRMSTRIQRSPRISWWPGSISTGGVHVHHLVFGIVIMMLVGFLEFAFEPTNPWLSILAVSFGVGVGLTLDEFALWLHLQDVYWSDEGRQSIDAVVIAAVVAGLIIVAAPLDLDDEPALSLSFIGLTALQLTVCSIAFLKGKIVLGLVGLFVPLAAYIGMLRLAKPGSPWARRRYPEGSKKLARATDRYGRVEGRRVRLQDLIGGTPSSP